MARHDQLAEERNAAGLREKVPEQAKDRVEVLGLPVLEDVPAGEQCAEAVDDAACFELRLLMRLCCT